MKACDAMILYHAKGEGLPPVRVVPVGENDRSYRCSSGAAYTAWRDGPIRVVALLLFIEFHTLVVREKIDPQRVHEAFLAIDEYRQLIADDIPGAEDQSKELARVLEVAGFKP